ncbi:MAG: hypothetical protein BWY67_00069 [Bacteroidetes bacterium ADurb.Bin397]|nr:MAG: hypothetical protein BWY67_00069 [Bacteroidetes bacterium ADurb.Bin397]
MNLVVTYSVLRFSVSALFYKTKVFDFYKKFIDTLYNCAG